MTIPFYLSSFEKIPDYTNISFRYYQETPEWFHRCIPIDFPD